MLSGMEPVEAALMELDVSETTDGLTLVLLPLYVGATMVLGRPPVEPTYALADAWL